MTPFYIATFVKLTPSKEKVEVTTFSGRTLEDVNTKIINFFLEHKLFLIPSPEESDKDWSILKEIQNGRQDSDGPLELVPANGQGDGNIYRLFAWEIHNIKKERPSFDTTQAVAFVTVVEGDYKHDEFYCYHRYVKVTESFPEIVEEIVTVDRQMRGCTPTISEDKAFVSNAKGEFIAFAFTHRYDINDIRDKTVIKARFTALLGKDYDTPTPIEVDIPVDKISLDEDPDSWFYRHPYGTDGEGFPIVFEIWGTQDTYDNIRLGGPCLMKDGTVLREANSGVNIITNGDVGEQTEVTFAI